MTVANLLMPVAGLIKVKKRRRGKLGNLLENKYFLHNVKTRKVPFRDLLSYSTVLFRRGHSLTVLQVSL